MRPDPRGPSVRVTGRSLWLPSRPERAGSRGSVLGQCLQILRAALQLCCKMQAGFDSLMTAQLFAYLRAISPTQVREAMLAFWLLPATVSRLECPSDQGANRLFLYKSAPEAGGPRIERRP